MYILVKTLRDYGSGSYSDPSINIVEIREVDFQSEFPHHYQPPNHSIWVTKEDSAFKYYIVNTNNITTRGYLPVFDEILQIVKQYIRDNKLNEIGI